MPGDDNDDIPEYFYPLFILAFSLSITSSILLDLLLRKKKSNYSKLMRYIILSEAIFIFSEFSIIFTDKFKWSENYFHYICFFNISSEKVHYYMAKINFAFYQCNQTFSLLINCFVCLETIITVRNPISPVRTRLRCYIILTFFLSILSFSISMYFNNDVLDMTEIMDKLFSIDYAVSNFNTFLFFNFVIIGVLSFIYLINRFCLRKNMASNLRNKFVIKHICYYIVYLILQTPYYTYNFIYYIINRNNDEENPIFFSISILLHLSLGFVMSIIRASETNFYNFVFFCKKNKNNIEKNYLNLDEKNSNEKKIIQEEIIEGFLDPDQPLTVMISKTLNLEFMCCVLYGISTIYDKNSKHMKKKNLIKDEEQKSTDFLIDSNLNKSNSSTSNSKNISVTNNEFKRIKSHLIYYNKIYENFDLDDIGMEVKNSQDDSCYILRTLDSSNINSNLIDPSSNKQDALIIEYCPKIFKHLRKIDEISHDIIKNSFDPKKNKNNMEKIKESEGKSGSFFFFSHDQKFLIKTLTSSELNTFLGDFSIHYYDHLVNHPDTLLAKIYGVYTVIINDVSKINVVLMQNLFVFPKDRIKRIFDLKGSKVDRFTKNIQNTDKFKTLKDLDFQWMTKVDPELIDFTKSACMELDYVLQCDLAMLRDVNIMDYSLMLIVINFPSDKDSDYQSIINVFGEQRNLNKIFKSRNEKYIYVLGLIDYLQKFNLSKFLENKYKSILYGKEMINISAVDPILYGKRMHNFAIENIFVSNMN